MYLADREQLAPQPFHRGTSVLGKEKKERKKEINTNRKLYIWNHVTNIRKKNHLKGNHVYIRVLMLVVYIFGVYVREYKLTYSTNFPGQFSTYDETIQVYVLPTMQTLLLNLKRT